ncbi:DegT/DnrJ/EryC1/StrS family aminotransferase [Streptomyces qinzhouensis]|nr:aminotransferase class I/II-fold pyridoxal phosphate-dependent enzyme [Streptomyces qinzhouensis]
MPQSESAGSVAPDLDGFEAIPKTGIERARHLMESGALYRYVSADPYKCEVSLLEKEFAEYLGSRFALAVNSCGSALRIAMLCSGVRAGDRVLSSGFTYTAVPSAIVGIGAVPVLVECDENLCIDTVDLERKIESGGRYLLLSHMRGHISDMESITALCRRHGVKLIEDSAHGLGASFAGKPAGRFGEIGCFSTQSHKLLNAGEGGLLVTDDEEIIAKAVLYSGSQETFWQRHFTQSPHFARLQNKIPNLSLRMNNVSAALLRAQLTEIDKRLIGYRQRYRTLTALVAQSPYIGVPKAMPEVSRSPDTLQFHLLFDGDGTNRFVARLADKGVHVKLFGAPGNPRFFKSWEYIDGIRDVHLPNTERILKATADLRLPGYLTDADVRWIAETMCSVAHEVGASQS